MSQIRMKLVLVSLGLLLIATPTAFGQISQMRLFSPYPDDSFGGGSYAREGVYGSIGAGMLNVPLPPTQTIGFSDWGRGGYDQMPYYCTNVFKDYLTVAKVGNQLNTSQLKSEFTPATEFEVGNIRGHHGWSVKGTIMRPVKGDTSGLDASVGIYDPRSVNVYTYLTNAQISASDNEYWIWDNDHFVKAQEGANNPQIGRLWAMVNLSGSQTSDSTSDYGTNPSTDTTSGAYAFVPIPFIFDMYSVETNLNYWSVEAMYTYRFHPFRRGMFELLAGIRYTVFDDSMKVTGHATTRTDNEYSQTRIDILNKGGSTTVSTGVVSDSQNQQYDSNTINNNTFSGVDLGWSNWNFDAQNHIVGPQVGGRYTLSNARWRLMGEGKFFAGFNRQNLRGYGQFGFKAESTQSGDYSDTGGVPLKAPLGTNANAFSYKGHYDVFTPGAEVNVSAVWYWTEAVSFKVGYNFSYFGDIARGSAFNDYVINDSPDGSAGTYFKIKENKDDWRYDTFVHGIMFTAQINK